MTMPTAEEIFARDNGESYGLTKREEFAKVAMQALIAAPIKEWPNELQTMNTSRAAVAMADALLIALATQ